MELRCPSRMHGIVELKTIEVKCRSARCGARKGAVVLHSFDLSSGELIETKKFKEPGALFENREE